MLLKEQYSTGVDAVVVVNSNIASVWPDKTCISKSETDVFVILASLNGVMSAVSIISVLRPKP